MPNSKITFEFVQGVSGWSETFYAPIDVGAQLESQGFVWAALRAKLLPTGTTINAFRMTQMAAPNLSQFFALAFTGDSGYPPDLASVSALVRLYTGVNNGRAYEVRGIPDACTSGAAYAPIGTYGQDMQNMLDQIVKSGWAVRSINRANPLVQYQAISTLGVLQFAAQDAQAWVNTVYLRFFRSRANTLGAPAPGFALKGLWAATFVNATTYQLANWPPGNNTYGLPGRVRLSAVTYVPFTAHSVQAIRLNSRKTGRPFGTPLGRRRVRASFQGGARAVG